MTYEIRAASPPAAAFTRRGRPGGATGIHQIQLHATRGPTTLGLQVQATENWFANQDDKGGWGSSADYVVGPDDRVSGEVVLVSFGDSLRTFGSWSAGYGSIGASQEWGAAEVGVAIEIAQDKIDTPYSAQTVAAVAWLCHDINQRIREAGGVPVPAVRLDYWNQRRDAPIPRGYLSHEDLANGVRLGKSDVGPMWPWDDFMALMAEDEPEDMSPDVSSLEAAIATWHTGVTPLPIDGDWNRYELRMRRD